MPERSNDRRAQKTRKALTNALSELLTEKELHKITVQEICDKADVNRGTLYRHYLDVYDLYDKIEKDTIVSFGLLMLELEEGPADVFFKKIIGYISENRSIFGMVFSPNTTGQLRSKLSEIIKGVFMQKQLEKEESSLSEAELDYMCSYRAQGCIAVIADWVTGGFKEPEEQMIGIISKLDKNTEKIF
ncbi:transcriptional regulator, TetR family [Ruminococcaceae bacterium FB2012]|nr:transcriptional regulator, TetR family [Ruminococcaceae bacterium FB2012]